MKLKLIDRLTLPTIFPQKSSFEKLIIIDDIKKKIALTQKEIKDFEIETTTENTIKWNEKASTKEFDIEFTESEVNMIADQLKKLSKEEALTARTFQLYKVFVK